LKNSKYNMPQTTLREQPLPCRKWWLRVMSAAMVSLACVVFMDHQILAQIKIDADPMMKGRDSGTRNAEEVYEAFRDRKMSRLQGLEIAKSIIEQSRRTEIAVETFLGVMRTESNFTVRAVSSSHAMGLMQIHPVTWNRYTKKLSLPASREDAFRPSVNILVSAAILRDLYDKYRGMGYREPELWDHVFSAYYAGEGSVRGGLNRRHLHYVKKVRTHIGEYSQRLDG